MEDILRRVKSNPRIREVGTIVCFIGIVRGLTRSGALVEKMEVEAYEEKANETLAKICKELSQREGIVDVQIHHNIGSFDVGEELVYVVVAGGHREHVFPVLVEAVERYKREAELWKKEYTTSGAYWVNDENGKGMDA
ncbi:MAG: molybdenum cofactor biosynthesis protein MoaE [Candidatus Freyarchaeota archaeon]|nr:molybdenum cofactor biosynthesis protein MoaE [Candidatus Jordarchaeia archaeon]